MEFEISRTSASNNGKPHDRAIREGDAWVIEINSLEELLGLIEGFYGRMEMVVGRHEAWQNLKGEPERLSEYYIEIYDTYRE